MNPWSRREFLKCSCGVAVGAIGLTRGGRGLASQPGLKFPAEPRARLAIASWSFRSFIASPTNRERNRNQPAMDLKDFVGMVVKKFGVHNIEPLDDHFNSTKDAYIRELRQTVEKAGAHVVNIAVGGKSSFYDPDPSQHRAAVDHGKKWVDIAVTLGSPSVRAHMAGVHNLKPDVDRAAESLAQLASYGAEKNIIINLENDDLKSEDAFFLVKVIEKVNSPYLHALPDFCNSMLSGNERYNYDAVTAMFKHAYNIAHMKDSELDSGKLYRTDVGRTFGIARAAGYRGYFSIEWEGKGEPYSGVQNLIEQSLKYLI